MILLLKWVHLKSLDTRHGDTGYSYENLFAEYFDGAKNVELQELYLSSIYQLQNLTCFTEINHGKTKSILIK